MERARRAIEIKRQILSGKYPHRDARKLDTVVTKLLEDGTMTTGTIQHLQRDEAIMRIRVALRNRTGKAWSVVGGRGTGWGWLTITAPPKRHTNDAEGGPCTDDASRYYLTLADRIELGNIFTQDGRPAHCQGVSVSPDDRERIVALAEQVAQ